VRKDIIFPSSLLVSVRWSMRLDIYDGICTRRTRVLMVRGDVESALK
jgi:hypothetical protein